MGIKQIYFRLGLILMIEITRLCFKIHSYLRNKLLYSDPSNEEYIYYIPEWVLFGAH
jgi:hypothetical protein